MGVYFGTDGFRGIYGEAISPDIAYKVGNSLGTLCKKKKVIIGRDTRRTGSILTLAFSSGIMSSGVDVVDIGVAPSPVIAFLTKDMGFDYGIVVSASHNPRNYNGIKIFDSEGYKIKESVESIIERKLLYTTEYFSDKVGRYNFRPRLINRYKNHITGKLSSLKGLKIALDLANGASVTTAKDLFEKLGAKVLILNNGRNGKKINYKCGALEPEKMAKTVVQYGCDMGFAFDGDADRIIACNEKGKILDGDDLLFILAKPLKQGETVVGTSMTNKGLECALNEMGLNLARADVGDKYVVEMMKAKGSRLGGESSGHIINADFATTGDGVLTALTIAEIVKRTGTPLSKLASFTHFPQITINVEVVDKYRLLNSDLLSAKVLEVQKMFGANGRALIRASGTESKIRVMCEHKDSTLAISTAQEIADLIKGLN